MNASPPVHKYAMAIQYQGTNFSGWQSQKNVETIQDTLERALLQLCGRETIVAAAGRTDAGVHALCQVATFESTLTDDERDWARGINALTPSAIQVHWVIRVPGDFNARYSADSRTYKYLFFDADRFDPFIGELSWPVDKLNSSVMHSEAQALLGEQDFSTFRAAGCQSKTPYRCVNRCSVDRFGDFVVLEIEANAFLFHMVRNIASALKDVGQGARTNHINDLIKKRDRTQLGVTAPPSGLYLTKVAYEAYSLPTVNDKPSILRALSV